MAEDNGGLLKALLTFLTESWKKLPGWARVTAYFIFLALFVVMTLNATTGPHTFAGTLSLRKLSSDEQARSRGLFDIAYQGEEIGIARHGRFIIPLSFSEYAMWKAVQSIPLAIRYDTHPIACTKVPLIRGDRLKTIELAALNVEGGGGRTSNGDDDSECAAIQVSNSSSLIGRAHAATQQRPDEMAYRLFVRGLSEDFAAGDELALRFKDGSERSLHDRSTGNVRKTSSQDPEGTGEAMRNYFPVPKGVEDAAAIAATLVQGSGGLFRINAAKKAAGLLTIKKSFGVWQKFDLGNGVSFEGALFLPYDVLLFDKKDISSTKNKIRSDLTAKGYLVTELPSFLSESEETNALFAGNAVELEALQDIVRTIEGSDVGLKTIQPQMKLKSGNPLEIQIGGSRPAAVKPALSKEQLNQAINAKDWNQFRQVAGK